MKEMDRIDGYQTKTKRQSQSGNHISQINTIHGNCIKKYQLPRGAIYRYILTPSSQQSRGHIAAKNNWCICCMKFLFGNSSREVDLTGLSSISQTCVTISDPYVVNGPLVITRARGCQCLWWKIPRLHLWVSDKHAVSEKKIDVYSQGFNR